MLIKENWSPDAERDGVICQHRLYFLLSLLYTHASALTSSAMVRWTDTKYDEKHRGDLSNKKMKEEKTAFLSLVRWVKQRKKKCCHSAECERFRQSTYAKVTGKVLCRDACCGQTFTSTLQSPWDSSTLRALQRLRNHYSSGNLSFLFGPLQGDSKAPLTTRRGKERERLLNAGDRVRERVEGTGGKRE